MKLYKKYLCFNVNNLQQALDTTAICQIKKIIPIFYIRFYIINGFGPDWIIEFKNLLLIKFNKNKFELFVNCKKNYGLFFNLVNKKINFLKVEGDKQTLSKLNQIAKKNKITINPKFDIIDLSKIKNIEKKINKYNKQY